MDIQTIIAFAKPVLQKHNIKKAALFGSIVRDRAHSESDIDMLVDLPDGFGYFDLAGLKVELEEKFKKEVDLVEYKAIRPELRESILKHEHPFL